MYVLIVMFFAINPSHFYSRYLKPLQCELAVQYYRCTNPIYSLLGGGERDVVEAGAEGSSVVDTRSLLVSRTAGNANLEAEGRGDVAVGGSVATAASTGTVGLCDGGTSALTGREATATLLAFAVTGALDEDGLLGVLVGGSGSRCSRGGRSSRCSGRSGNGSGSGSTTEAASLTPRASRNEAGSALASGAASGSALAVVAALASDELGASSLARASRRDGGGSSRSSRGNGATSCTLASLRVVDTGCLGLAAKSDGRNVVGGDVAKPAPTVTLLGDDSGSALAGLETTA
jgi:hypothetical protein